MSAAVTPADRERLGQLSEQAESRFLERMDFWPEDWLDEPEAAEFRRLYNKVNGFPEEEVTA